MGNPRLSLSAQRPLTITVDGGRPSHVSVHFVAASTKVVTCVVTVCSNPLERRLPSNNAMVFPSNIPCRPECGNSGGDEDRVATLLRFEGHPIPEEVVPTSRRLLPRASKGLHLAVDVGKRFGPNVPERVTS